MEIESMTIPEIENYLYQKKLNEKQKYALKQYEIIRRITIEINDLYALILEMENYDIIDYNLQTNMKKHTKAFKNTMKGYKEMLGNEIKRIGGQ